MITKEEFISLINNHKKWDSRIDQVCDVLKIDMFDTDWIDYGYALFTETISLLFNDMAKEDISWWLWDKNGNPEMKMWDSNDNEIPTETVEDLWEIVKDNRK